MDEMTTVQQSPNQEWDELHAARAWPSNRVGRLGGFAILIFVIALVLHALIDHGLRRIDTSSFGVSNRIVNGTINADIVISGSSRALSHYDPRLIAAQTGLSVFNIGLNGSQTDMQVARLRTYLRHNRPPSVVIHNLDAFSFQSTHGGVYDPAQYVPYLGETEIYEALRRIDPAIWKSKFIPLYGYTVEDMRFEWIVGFAGFFGWQPREDHFLGFKPRHIAWTDEFERFSESNRNGMRFEIEPDGIREMQNLLDLCHDNGIGVILVYSPEYLAVQGLTNNRADIFAKFEELARRYHVPLWDYSSSAISANKYNFYNSQHLNADGADVFSREIALRLATDPIVTGMISAPQRGKSLAEK
jgi:hypothetical protein